MGSSRGVAICGVVRACTLQGREHCAGGGCPGRTWRERHTEGLRASWPRASDRSRVKQRIHPTTAHFTPLSPPRRAAPPAPLRLPPPLSLPPALPSTFHCFPGPSSPCAPPPHSGWGALPAGTSPHPAGPRRAPHHAAAYPRPAPPSLPEGSTFTRGPGAGAVASEGSGRMWQEEAGGGMGSRRWARRSAGPAAGGGGRRRGPLPTDAHSGGRGYR